MSKSRAEIDSFFHGRVDIGHETSAEYVVAHAARQKQRGRNPSVAYKGIKDPRLAYKVAQSDIAARAEDTGFMGYTSDFSGRVAIMHVWHENQMVPASSYANARIENNGGVGAIIQVDMPEAMPIPSDPHPDGTIELPYHFS